MSPLVMFGLAAMLVLLLPAAVAAWEHTLLPPGYYAALGLAGCVFAFVKEGWAGAGFAIAATMACVAVLGIALTLQRRAQDRQLLSGESIQLVGAGATWCGLPSGLVMLALALAAHVGVALLLRIRKSARPRPHFALSAAGAMLTVVFLRGWWGPS